MTRGKHGQAAAVRHEVQSRDAEIETYKNAVARLTASLKALKGVNEERRQSWAKRERELLARLDAAASPKIEALELLVRTRTSERDNAEKELQRITRRNNTAFVRIRDHLIEEHQYAEVTAIEAAAMFIGVHEDTDWDPLAQPLVLDKKLESHLRGTKDEDFDMRLQTLARVRRDR